MLRPRLGLVLSGGGARGFAHIGVLKVLVQAGIPIDCISGTSMGGVIAAAFACKIPVKTIEEKAIQFSQMKELVKLIDLSPRRRGFLQGKRVRDFLTEFFLDRTFESLDIPLAMLAVDLIQAEEIHLTKGLILPAVMATIAVPGIFQPVEINGHRLVDGGVLNNLPVDLARQLGADIVIAVDALSDPLHASPWQNSTTYAHFQVSLPDYLLDLYRAELIMVASLAQEHLKVFPPDILLCPSIPLDITIFMGFNRIAEIISVGEECARNALPEIQTLLAKTGSPRANSMTGD